MKLMFIMIGLLLLVGGAASLVAPRANTVSKANELRDTSDTALGYSKEMTRFFGYSAVSAGVIALVVGARSSGQLSPPPKPVKDQDAGTGGWE